MIDSPRQTRASRFWIFYNLVIATIYSPRPDLSNRFIKYPLKIGLRMSLGILKEGYLFKINMVDQFH